jgi:large subunit ribosomal protein L15
MEGSMKRRRRWGRGTGSGRGKLCGYGHQKSRSTPLGFEGGQTPLYKRLPKIGFRNHTRREMLSIDLQTIHEYIIRGRLIPKANEMLTMKDLVEAGITTNPLEGVKLLGKGGENFNIPIHLEVSQASKSAIEAIEKSGGTVTCVHFNKLAMRALLKPQRFEILPWRARPIPTVMQYYLNKDNAGYLSPEIQARNLKLFGHVTSEAKLREEHEAFMAYVRSLKNAGKEYPARPARLFVA